MSNIFGKIVFVNGKLMDVAQVSPEFFSFPFSLYEVLRVIDGCPLFVEDHLDRLANSCVKSSKNTLLNKKKIVVLINELISKAGILNSNIKISFNYSDTSECSLIHYIQTQYPTLEEYSLGVKVSLYNAKRENPSVKKLNSGLRTNVDAAIKNTGAYEALLLDENEQISEGSKSNVFFIKGKKLYTAPDSLVLGGITRKYILELAHSLKIKIVYKAIPLSELDKFDAAFICGTSPKVLPICCIDNLNFDTQNALCLTLGKEYNKLIDKYI